MKITNAIINNVTVGFDKYGDLSAIIRFDSQYRSCFWRFVLTNSTDVQRLIRLMNYTKSNEFSDLSDKIIRLVYSSSDSLCGFGHPIEDKLVPTLTENFKEIKELEFKEILKYN